MKTAIFMLGSPGSGKSFIAKRVAAEKNIKSIVDCDFWKTQHPEYDPKNPSKVHEWSKKRADAELALLIAHDETFIYDGTGANAEALVQRINTAQAAGYKTEIVYVSCPLQKCIQRNATRERSVSEEMLREKHSTIAISFEIVSKYVDAVTVITND